MKRTVATLLAFGLLAAPVALAGVVVMPRARSVLAAK